MTNTEDQETRTESTSLTSTLSSTISIISTSPSEAIHKLTTLQNQIALCDLFSPKSNETLEDLSTSTLPLLSVEHHLASAYLNLGAKSSVERHANIIRCKELWIGFLQRMESLEEVLPPHVLDAFHKFLDGEEHEEEESPGSGRLPAMSREDKIIQFRKKEELEQRIAQLQSLRERRGRLGVLPDDTLDGYDDEGLARTLHISMLQNASMEAMDELIQTSRELLMLTMAIRIQNQNEPVEDTRTAPPSKPLEVTRIHHDPNGQLLLRKEVVKSQVFRPGWNQPTMSLEEYGERERQRATQRSHDQALAEEQAKLQPRRYEQLVTDGMEDDADLVDRCAAVDRKWDDFKDANPRGSGNKMADRGDKNF